MTTDELPPFPVDLGWDVADGRIDAAFTGSIYFDHRDMRAYAQSTRAPLLAKIAEQEKEIEYWKNRHTDAHAASKTILERAEKAERELSQTQSDRQKEHDRRVAAEGTVEDLRAKLEAAQKVLCNECELAVREVIDATRAESK